MWESFSPWSSCHPKHFVLLENLQTCASGGCDNLARPSSGAINTHIFSHAGCAAFSMFLKGTRTYGLQGNPTNNLPVTRTHCAKWGTNRTPLYETQEPSDFKVTDVPCKTRQLALADVTSGESKTAVCESLSRLVHRTMSVPRGSMPTEAYDLENTATDDRIGATAFTYKNLIYILWHLDPFSCNKIWEPANNDNWGKINYVMLFWKAVTNFILPISASDLSVKVLHLGSVPSGPLSVSNPSSPPPLTALFRVLPFFTLPPSDTLWLTDNNKHLENSFKWAWRFPLLSLALCVCGGRFFSSQESFCLRQPLFGLYQKEAVSDLAASPCGSVDGQTNQHNFTIIKSNIQSM